ncbi:RpiB/LacA/LacB family sugar-phosphate isomerase [Denitrobaculum tricleocarpae]|uniref:RpiB/LacA/LacB family sugar-phosphate isomerase n=1 Tax=Denitrobaculum tricleocarpae TaxID=2591009 RepID=A0A545SZB5_9PROT|nr:RpiB/LacA/LacB family sugar-phosphate isomerase [Denitrobaculum tricleocarpae]TQV70318.1 RpiB/LacA/LacB family sugar-phosphate isomerase [Denitrobaculum tricleocarpae]
MTDSGIKVKKLGIGCDHLGLAMKNDLRDHLAAQGIEVVDLGVHDETPVDYPDMGSGLARELAAGAFERGILICGTGAGMAIAANKVPGVRAVCVTDPYTAERAIASNDAHVVTFGAQITGLSVARMLADIFIRNSFQGGRSAPKVAKLAALDEAR